MKILGIGNAIVDVLCKVDDNFLVKNSLTKSTMKLIDEDEFIEGVIESDGRGHTLSSYDGTENEISFDDEWYYIYRTN